MTYGNHFTNSYLGRDWTGVAISPKFDFTIIHESAHEWFGTLSRPQTGRTCGSTKHGPRISSLYTWKIAWGKADGLKYLNGYKPKIQNRQAIVPQLEANATPPEDQYFKGALFINTIRAHAGKQIL